MYAKIYLCVTEQLIKDLMVPRGLPVVEGYWLFRSTFLCIIDVQGSKSKVSGSCKEMTKIFTENDRTRNKHLYMDKEKQARLTHRKKIEGTNEMQFSLLY